MSIKIPEFPKISVQTAQLGNHKWSVARLIELAKDLPVMDIPLDHLYMYNSYKSLTLREMVMHIKTVLESDLSFPIILDEDGEIMDGRHRIMKAIYLDVPTIKAVRFSQNPKPCSIIDES